MGSEVQAFERELADYLHVPSGNVSCVNSGTAAVHLALAAVLKPGDEVLVQSLTFVATFQAITAAGGVPVACEVRPETITLDVDDARRRLTPRAKAVVPVHYASNPAGLDEIHAFAKEHGLRVVEDAAHAFGCTYNGNRIGSFGDVACFSFDGIKNITSGEGGAVVTADASVSQRVRDARLLGVEKDTEKRYRQERSWEFDVSRQGWRYHMSNLFAAIGRVQLRRLDREFAPRRVELARRYRERLSGVRGVRLLETDLGVVVPHIQPVRVLNGRRDVLSEVLRTAGVEVGIHYKPNHLLTLYRGAGISLPITEQLYGELLSLPLHPALDISDVDRVCDIVEASLKRG
jgi:dTDP-4-amino-4,6-dideoxygalactose transaminase